MGCLFLFYIIIHYEKQGAKKRPKTKGIMKWVYNLFFLACSITLKAQGADEGCITCAVGKFFETGSFPQQQVPAVLRAGLIPSPRHHSK